MNPRKTPSIQKINRSRQRDAFVGREDQVDLFRRNLALAPDDERRRFVFAVSGQGGVGKSTLLRRFRQFPEGLRVVSALVDESEFDVVTVMSRIADQLKEQGHPLTHFSERYKVYRQRRQELEADPERPTGFSAFMGRIIAKGGLGLARQIPIGGVAADFVDEDALGKLTGESLSFVARKIGNKDEVHLIHDPIETLTPLFLADLCDIAEQQTVVLFFDTFERTDSYLEDWLLQLLEGDYGDVSGQIIFVIAGRDELDRNRWAPYEWLLARLPLDPFTEEEARDYLARQNITDQRVIETILHLSGRFPLLVAMLATTHPNDPSEVADPTDTAIDRFLKWVEDPRQRQLAIDAALPRQFNRDIIALLVAPEQLDSLFSWLINNPFVSKRGDGWVYHEVVRSHTLRYKRRESPQSWAELHNKLAAYHDQRRAVLGFDDIQGRRNAIWQHHALEALYHSLCHAPYKALPSAISGCLLANEADHSFGNRWAALISEAGRNGDVDEVYVWGNRLTDAFAHYYADNYAEALTCLDVLLKNLDFQKDHAHARLLVMHATSLRALGRYEEAVKDFSSIIVFSPFHVFAFARRGDTYRQMQRYDEALRDLDRAIELNPTYASAFGSRGQTYHQMKHYEEALANLSQAIELNPSYAWAFSSRGQTYLQMRRHEEALADFSHAIELNPSIYWVVANRGETYRQMRRYEEALTDFSHAIELNPSYSFAFGCRGQIYTILKRYQEAFADISRAIQLKPSDDWWFYQRSLINKLLTNQEAAQIDLTTAIQLGQQIHIDNPNDWRTTCDLAIYHLVANTSTKAEQLYRSALTDGAPPERIKAAIDDLDELLELFPDQSHAAHMRDLLQSALASKH